MGGFRRAVSFLAAVILFTGCAAPVRQSAEYTLPDVVGSMELKYAGQFSVDYLADGTALAEIADGRRYLIIPEGAAVPEQIPEDITVIKQPENIYLASSSAMDLFDCLGGLDDILATSTPESGWKLPDIAQAMADEDILYAGKYSSPDIELLMSEGCDHDDISQPEDNRADREVRHSGAHRAFQLRIPPPGTAGVDKTLRAYSREIRRSRADLQREVCAA